jgi:hypothetical protein
MKAALGLGAASKGEADRLLLLERLFDRDMEGIFLLWTQVLSKSPLHACTQMITFIDVLSTAQYALLPFISHAKALQLSSTCRAARGIIVPMLWLCQSEGRLHWISGHEASFLDGNLHRAKYSDLCGIAMQGNHILLSDSHNNVLRRLSKEGDILTSRVEGPRGMCIDEDQVYAACDKGICQVSLQQPLHCTILRHLPRLIKEFPGPLMPFHVCKVGKTVYLTDFSSKLHYLTLGEEQELKSLEIHGSVLAGMCKDQESLLVCDYGRGRVLRVLCIQEEVQTVCEYPRVRCIAKHENILYVSSDTELIEFRPRKLPLVRELDIGIKALAITTMGTPIIASFSQVFAVV